MSFSKSFYFLWFLQLSICLQTQCPHRQWERVAKQKVDREREGVETWQTIHQHPLWMTPNYKISHGEGIRYRMGEYDFIPIFQMLYKYGIEDVSKT